MPDLFVIGGPNGAGKTSVAYKLLPDFLHCYEFVNADLIARGLSPFRPEQAAFAAGRAMIRRIQELTAARESFAFESTLASRSFVPFLKRCRKAGYRVHVIYVWVREVQLCVERVKQRVLAGGHRIPEEDIIRRYGRSKLNLLKLYRPLADTWVVYDNSGEEPRQIAKKGLGGIEEIRDIDTWKEFQANDEQA